MAASEVILGLNLTRRTVQAVAIERTATSAILQAIDEWNNTLLTDPDQPQQGGVEEFRNTLSAFLKVSRIKSRKAYVALDMSYLFVTAVPFSRNASRQEFATQTQWELQQYFPDESPADFVSDTVKLSPRTEQQTDEYLCVAVRRRHARTIGGILGDCGFELHVLDGDHFSAETSFRINYPDSVRRYVAFAGIKDGRVDVSMLRHGSLESYRYTVVRNGYESAQVLADLSKETSGIQSIVTYGPALSKELLMKIRRASSILVEAVNPLRRVQVSDSVRLADSIQSPPYRFAAAIGVALRQD